MSVTNNNNSTVNNSLTTDCGVGNYCYSPQVCFAATEGPICGDINSNIPTYSWKLNSTVFPPIEYIGKRIGRRSRDQCERFDSNSWSDENKNWLLSYFYQYWNGNNTNTIPLGSFIRPLDYIGSCSNIIISSSGISLQQLYCDNNNRCRRKINTQRVNCDSSNQCLSQLCGFIPINQHVDGNITVTNTTCVSDGFLAYDQLRGDRAFNVMPGDEVSIQGNNNNNNSNDDDSKNSLGSMVIIIIILVILFASMAIYGYARKMFKKRDSDDDETHYLRREIDPETGEIVTVSTLGGRVRRGTSLLLNRNSLNRSNSIRTLPPYTVVEEERPFTTSNGIVNSITQYFFPPGELPPPYDSTEENENESNNNITLDEVREGVTIEGNGNGGNGNGDGGNGNGNGNENVNNNGNGNGNGNNSANSTSPSRRTSTTPEVTVDDSEAFYLKLK